MKLLLFLLLIPALGYGVIKRDEYGYVMDDTMDGGDSANRAGILAMLGSKELLRLYEVGDGILVRHPKQSPWNNPKNFSRDQLVAFVGGLYAQGETELAKRVFWSRARNFFFAQNTERDEVGTTKYPWPHSFINDHGQPESRNFDFADPLFPDTVMHMILAAKIYPLYVFGIIGLPYLAMSILIHKDSETDDEGQLIAQCIVAGKPFVRLYRATRKDWKGKLRAYWGRRNQIEIAEWLTAKIEGT